MNAYLKLDGIKGEGKRSSASFFDVFTELGLRVEATGNSDIKGETLRASDMFLKLDGIKGERTQASASFFDVFTELGFQVTATGNVDIQGKALRAKAKAIPKAIGAAAGLSHDALLELLGDIAALRGRLKAALEGAGEA